MCGLGSVGLLLAFQRHRRDSFLLIGKESRVYNKPMTSITRSVQILIHTSLQTAFDYVSDLTKHPEWSGGELKIEAVSSEPIRVGKEYISKGEFAIQKERPNKLRITEFEPPHKFGFVANDPTIGDVFHTFTFSEKENQVLITRTMKLNLNPFMAFGFTIFVYPLTGNPSMKKALQNLKARLESEKINNANNG